MLSYFSTCLNVTLLSFHFKQMHICYNPLNDEVPQVCILWASFHPCVFSCYVCFSPNPFLDVMYVILLYLVLSFHFPTTIRDLASIKLQIETTIFHLNRWEILYSILSNAPSALSVQNNNEFLFHCRAYSIFENSLGTYPDYETFHSNKKDIRKDMAFVCIF